jgi:hypothetical protein
MLRQYFQIYVEADVFNAWRMKLQWAPMMPPASSESKSTRHKVQKINSINHLQFCNLCSQFWGKKIYITVILCALTLMVSCATG